MNKPERKFLFHSMKYLPQYGTVVEIGSFLGRSSMALGGGIKKYRKSITLYCVDIFSDEYYKTIPGLWEEAKKKPVIKVFEKNMKDLPHKTLVMDSLSAVKLFNDLSVDFVFIDANHSYEAVRADIMAWYPKVKTGGIICGHDYGGWGVERAVKETFPVFDVPAGTIWRHIKTGV